MGSASNTLVVETGRLVAELTEKVLQILDDFSKPFPISVLFVDKSLQFSVILAFFGRHLSLSFL